MKSTILLPPMLFGTLNNVEQNVQHFAAECAKQLAAGTIPAPANFPVGALDAGSIIYTNPATDLDPIEERWRLYVVRKYFSVLASESEIGNDSLGSRCGLYDSTWWGALIALIGHFAPNSISRIVLLLRQVVDSWPQLSALNYVDKILSPVDLETLLDKHLSGLFAMWIDHSVRDTKSAIEEAIERGSHATKEEILERLTKVITQSSMSSHDVGQQAKLVDTAFVREQLSRLPEKRFMELSGGFTGSLRREIKLLAG